MTDDLLTGMRTADELMAMTDDDLDAAEHRTLLARQRLAFEAVTHGRCNPSCLASLDPWGPCCCPCAGSLHGSLWSSDVTDGGGHE